MITSKKTAITLIEVLIAIYIFGIGVLVIMRMIISNIFRLYDLRAKDVAVGLGKEAMDIVFHLRDSNIEKSMRRDCREVLQTGPSWSCPNSLLTSGMNMYRINFSLTGLYAIEEIFTTGDAVLRYHTGVLYTQSGSSYTGFWYSHNTTAGQETEFSRWIEVFPQQNYPTMTGRVLGVRSIVQYQRGSNIRQVVIESILGDMR